MFVKYIQPIMTTNPIVKGGKRSKGKGSRKGSKRQRRQNQNGGACGNSSSVAAAYGGNVPMNMPNQQGGSELQSSNYTAGNVSLTPQMGGASILPQMGGNAGLFKGGNSILPQMGGNAGLFKGGNNVIPTPGMPPMSSGGNVLNELAVPAVLLYANNTFGKKKNYTGRKFRRNGKKSRRVRTR